MFFFFLLEVAGFVLPAVGIRDLHHGNVGWFTRQSTHRLGCSSEFAAVC